MPLMRLHTPATPGSDAPDAEQESTPAALTERLTVTEPGEGQLESAPRIRLPMVPP